MYRCTCQCSFVYRGGHSFPCRHWPLAALSVKAHKNGYDNLKSFGKINDTIRLWCFRLIVSFIGSAHFIGSTDRTCVRVRLCYLACLTRRAVRPPFAPQWPLANDALAPTAPTLIFRAIIFSLIQAMALCVLNCSFREFPQSHWALWRIDVVELSPELWLAGLFEALQLSYVLTYSCTLMLGEQCSHTLWQVND